MTCCLTSNETSIYYCKHRYKYNARFCIQIYYLRYLGYLFEQVCCRLKLTCRTFWRQIIFLCAVKVIPSENIIIRSIDNLFKHAIVNS